MSESPNIERKVGENVTGTFFLLRIAARQIFLQRYPLWDDGAAALDRPITSWRDISLGHFTSLRLAGTTAKSTEYREKDLANRHFTIVGQLCFVRNSPIAGDIGPVGGIIVPGSSSSRPFCRSQLLT